MSQVYMVDVDVYCKKIEKDDQYIAIGSDGLWEYIPNKALVAKMLSYMSGSKAQAACRHLIKYAEQRWMSEMQGSDDISAYIIFL